MIILAISTSAGQFALLLGKNKKILFNSNEITETQELDFLLSEGLKKCNCQLNEISEILIDVGPGGTSRVRTGIAFANSLSYSLDIPIIPVSSMELAGIDCFRTFNMPVVFTVKSIKNNAYISVFDGNKLNVKFGKIDEILPEMLNNIIEFTVIGNHSEQIYNMESLKDKKIINSGKIFGNAEILIENFDLFYYRKLKFPKFAEAITENNYFVNNFFLH